MTGIQSLQRGTGAVPANDAAKAAPGAKFDPAASAAPAWPVPTMARVPVLGAEAHEAVMQASERVLDLVVNTNRSHPKGNVPAPVRASLEAAVATWRSDFLKLTENEPGGTRTLGAGGGYAPDAKSNMLAEMRAKLNDTARLPGGGIQEAFWMMKQLMVASPSIAKGNGHATPYMPPPDLITHVLGDWLAKPRPAPAPPPPVETEKLRDDDLAAILSGARGQSIYFKKSGHAAIRGGEKDEFGHKRKKKDVDKEEVAAKVDLSRYKGQALNRLDIQLGKLRGEENVTARVFVDGRMVGSFAKDGDGDDKISISAATLGGAVDASRVSVLIVPEKMDNGRHNSNFSVTGIDVALGGARV